MSSRSGDDPWAGDLTGDECAVEGLGFPGENRRSSSKLLSWRICPSLESRETISWLVAPCMEGEFDGLAGNERGPEDGEF